MSKFIRFINQGIKYFFITKIFHTHYSCFGGCGKLK